MKTTLLLSLALSVVISASADESSKIMYKTTAFVPPASPNVVVNQPQHASSTVTSSFIQTRFVAGVAPTVGRTDGPITTTTALFAKKKKDTTKGKGGKIQVKLLKFVDGTGSVGDVIMVAPAFFQNKLAKTNSAIRITDEQVAVELAEKTEHDSEEMDQALSMKTKIETKTLALSKKAGPDGHLFGGIGLKALLSELKNEFPKGALDAKHIKITSVKDEDEKKLKHDIKELGSYAVTIALLKGVSADFQVDVTAEN